MKTAISTDLTGIKLGLAAAMFIYSTLASLLPVIFVRFMDNRSGSSTDTDKHREEKSSRFAWWTPEIRTKILSRSNCLAAGALLTVGLMDVFIETMESFDTALESSNSHCHFPLASFSTLFGLFLVLGVERLTLIYYHTKHTDNASETADASPEHVSNIRRDNSQRTSFRLRATSLTAVAENVTVLPQTMETAEDAPPRVNNDPEHNILAHIKLDRWRRVIILLFALSLHSIFEGMAMGLCKTYASTLTLFVAVSMHKLLIAISIGLNLASETSNQPEKTRHRTKYFVYQIVAGLIFSGASPLGALIGWAVGTQTESVEFQWTSAVLQGIACGTFFYVVFCELLPKEMGEDRDKLGKLIFVIVGWCLVSIVIAFGPHEH